MIRGVILLIILISLSNITNAQIFEDQGFADKWYMGSGILDVSSASVDYDTVFNGMRVSGSTSSINYDDSGIVYATNGNTIYSYPGGKITGADSLSYHPSTGDSGDAWLIAGMPSPDLCLILPTLEPEQFSVFHIGVERIFVNGEPTPDALLPHLFQTTVTRQAGPPYGTVTEKRKIVFTDTLDQGLAAVRHGNGRDWWLMLNSRTREEQHLLRYGPEGIDSVATYEFDHDLNTTDGIDTLRLGPGESLFSPDGSLFAKIKYTVPSDTTLERWVTVYEFDRCTGAFEEWLDFRIPDGENCCVVPQSLAFSPNGRYLYVSTGGELYQYDLLVDDVVGSAVQIFDYYQQPEPDSNSFLAVLESIRLTPSGHLLVGLAGTTRYMHSIRHANQPAKDSTDLVWKFLDSLSLISGYLPNLPNYSLGPAENSPCDTLGIDYPPPLAAFEYAVPGQDSSLVNFYDSSSVYVTDWFWEFGDGNTGEGPFPVYQYDSLGAYEVCLTVSAPSGSDTRCRWLYLGVPPTSNNQEVFSFRPLHIYPNPARDRFYVALGPGFRGGTLSIFNSLGVAVGRNDLVPTPRSEIDTTGLASGLYVVIVEDKGGELWRGKIIIR
ncbi:hypothetical protein CEQ90_03145 [Lewinellaceae bacterium SD302]|nr:hypothetical protein CEQ90_03145 [Lewinellaceae bacterium SD302]